ncbi:hypothetical protein NKDENANG_03345 [Candidatus Entotheonellaceae bacterium PAL068K]
MDRHDLQQSVELALEMLDADATVVAAEVCASWSEYQTVRIHYDTDRPTDGLQQPQERTLLGVGILVVVEDRDGRRVGFGRDCDDVSVEGITLALEKAKANAVADPNCHVLPSSQASPSSLPVLYDPQILALPGDGLRRLALEAFNGALSALKASGYGQALHVSGTVQSRQEHLVVGNTNGLLMGETSTGLLASLQARLTDEQTQGNGSRSAANLDDFAAYDAGVEAAQQALQARGGITLAAGDYPLVFGPRAVADLLQDLLLPALSLDTVAAGSSPFAACLGQPVASSLLTLTDEARLPGLLGSRAITGEGWPTGTTPLLDRGRLVGFLADAYHAQKLAAHTGALPPHNGMRFATHGPSAGMRPGIFPTNVIFTCDQDQPLQALLEPVTNGIYVGGLGYIRPQDNLQTGAFTSTVTGPSFHIQQGKLTQPIQPGTMRLHDNVRDLLQRLTGISTTEYAVPLATMQSLVLAPDIRCSQAHFAV